MDSCTAGTPAADDSTCDGSDDDCDTLIDEDYVQVPTACGTGACASTGVTSCVGGAVQDSCTPGTPTTEVCDGVDNNCDGAADEEPAASASCEDGLFCTGTEACIAGTCQVAAEVCVDDCETCHEDTATCSWCIFDHNFNGATDGLDLAFFSGCFGLCYAPGDPCLAANYDGDAAGCVGGGDFGAFSGCFSLACASCTNCAGPGPAAADVGAVASVSVEASIQLVPVAIPSIRDDAEVLPGAVRQVRVGQTFYVEVWASRQVQGVEASDGLASVYSDVAYDGSRLVADQVVPSAAFENFKAGTIRQDRGQLSSIGGCAAVGDGMMGVDSPWVRVATVTMRAVAAGPVSVVLSPSKQPYGVSLFNRFGDLPVTQIELGSATLDVQAMPRVPQRKQDQKRARR